MSYFLNYPYVASLVLAGMILAGIWLAFVLIPALRHALAEGRRLKECGVLGPVPSDKAHSIMMRVCRVFIYLFVGKLEVQGAEKLANMPAPFLLAFNHGSMSDVAIAPMVLNRKARYPAAQGVMKAAGGLIAYWFSRWGAFSVDLDNGHAAFEASVNALCSQDGANIEVIFPEAWTNMDGAVGRMKTGTVRIAGEVSARLGKPCLIVPGYIRYGRYLGSWMTRLPIPVQWLTPLIFAPYFRRGARVVIGEPIQVSELPADPKEATEILKQKIMALDPGAMKG